MPISAMRSQHISPEFVRARPSEEQFSWRLPAVASNHLSRTGSLPARTKMAPPKKVTLPIAAVERRERSKAFQSAVLGAELKLRELSEQSTLSKPSRYMLSRKRNLAHPTSLGYISQGDRDVVDACCEALKILSLTPSPFSKLIGEVHAALQPHLLCEGSFRQTRRYYFEVVGEMQNEVQLQRDENHRLEQRLASTLAHVRSREDLQLAAEMRLAEIVKVLEATKQAEVEWQSREAATSATIAELQEAVDAAKDSLAALEQQKKELESDAAEKAIELADAQQRIVSLDQLCTEEQEHAAALEVETQAEAEKLHAALVIAHRASVGADLVPLPEAAELRAAAADALRWTDELRQIEATKLFRRKSSSYMTLASARNLPGRWSAVGAAMPNLARLASDSSSANACADGPGRRHSAMQAIEDADDTDEASDAVHS